MLSARTEPHLQQLGKDCLREKAELQNRRLGYLPK